MVYSSPRTMLGVDTMRKKRGIALTLALVMTALPLLQGNAALAGQSSVLRIRCDTQLVVTIKAESGSEAEFSTGVDAILWIDLPGRRLHLAESFTEEGRSTDTLLRLVNNRLYTETGGKGSWSPAAADFDRQLSGMSPSLLAALDGEALIRRAKELGYSRSEQNGLVLLEGTLSEDDPALEELLSLLPAGEESELREGLLRLTVDADSGRLTGIEWDITAAARSGASAETELHMIRRIECRYNAAFPPL